ncbi:MAG: type I 3-dehydroquinate dehydratase [Sporomusaceae bacterium]|nr:type I 3-dehydroquinate dehydratase [Sporomusaceae bacterium]
MTRTLIGQTSSALICTPLVGADTAELLLQLRQVLPKQPDVIEWRADFFAAVANAGAVIDTAGRIRELAGGLPLIFTVRSRIEGGQPIALTDPQVLSLNEAVCQTRLFDYVDCELRHESAGIERLRQIAHAAGTRLIGSYHNFQQTPPQPAIVAKLSEAAGKGLDVAKVAVMPQSPEDVLVLLGATLEAKKRLSIPLITMAMGGYGTVSRMIGGVFGSALTFAVGAQASAPGQIPIEALRLVLNTVEKTAIPQ